MDARIIDSISKSKWLSPICLGQKKGGMKVLVNEKDKLIPTQTVTIWRVCIDFWNLIDATCKDNFPLHFIDQVFERLSSHLYYCFLDGF